MRCFYHGDVEAVAVCKACGHGICHDCCAEVGTSAACRNRCESDVAALNAIIERNKSVYRKTSGVYLRNGWWMCAFGFLFVALAYLARRSGGFDYVLLAMAFFFILGGVMQFINARRFSDK